MINCFISFKKEDEKYKDKILVKLGKQRIHGKALDKPIEDKNIDYVMQEIRKRYIQNTQVTIFLIGEHSSENEGKDLKGDKNAYIKRELQATLYDAKGFPRSGLLGIVLPKMETKIYTEEYYFDSQHIRHKKININDSTVIKEFSKNYFLKKDKNGYYNEPGRFCVLARYCEFMQNPDKYIKKAYNKLSDPICNEVHWRDLRK